MSVRELIDRVYARLEFMESQLISSYKGSEGGLYAILDSLNQVYDLLAVLRRRAEEECSCRGEKL
ncbi:MAG: hypothetical protein NZ902_01940 [Acidilobaceae archaeon]|nr:hypothetical protein [Acidilobaceae archaeon]MCX8165585.1 hypothetical protein [Acidilobaceae archaeon]MDW7974012.1 hypothetical protein [Sulfolobales archaeon]